MNITNTDTANMDVDTIRVVYEGLIHRVQELEIENSTLRDTVVNQQEVITAQKRSITTFKANATRRRQKQKHMRMNQMYQENVEIE